MTRERLQSVGPVFSIEATTLLSWAAVRAAGARTPFERETVGCRLYPWTCGMSHIYTVYILFLSNITERIRGLSFDCISLSVQLKARKMRFFFSLHKNLVGRPLSGDCFVTAQCAIVVLKCVTS